MPRHISLAHAEASMGRRGDSTRTNKTGYQVKALPGPFLGRAAAPTVRVGEVIDEKLKDLPARDRAVRAAKIRRRGALKRINRFLRGE